MFPNTPIVAMVAPADPVAVPNGITTLRKPFHRQDLFNCLAKAASPSDRTKKTRQLRILAAEDNKTNQLVFRKMLKDLSLDLTIVVNGVEAVDAFTKDSGETHSESPVVSMI